MIPGRLFVVARALAGATDRILADALHHGCWTLHVRSGPGRLAPLPAHVQVDRLAGGPAVTDEMADLCAVSNTVSVIRPDDACPICDPSPAASPAGDRPAAVSDGQLPTAPAAGHPNPLHDAAEADERIAKRLNNFIARHRR